jgi:hypothetical protein
MLAIVWNVNCFRLINLVSKRIKFNANHYNIDILVALLEWRKTQVSGNDRNVIVHADSAPPPTARVTLKFLKQNGMKNAPHPPNSPDLAPSDIYLLSLRPHQATLGRTRIP